MMTTMNIWNYENSIVRANDEHYESSSSFVYPSESTLFEDGGAITNASNNWSRAIEGNH